MPLIADIIWKLGSIHVAAKVAPEPAAFINSRFQGGISRNMHKHGGHGQFIYLAPVASRAHIPAFKFGMIDCHMGAPRIGRFRVTAVSLSLLFGSFRLFCRLISLWGFSIHFGPFPWERPEGICTNGQWTSPFRQGPGGAHQWPRTTPESIHNRYQATAGRSPAAGTPAIPFP